MNEFSCEDKVKMALNGDKAAMNELVSYFVPTVESIASAYIGYGTLSKSDLVQEGMIGLLSSVHGFDCKQNSKFVTYACACIQNRIISAVKSHNKKGSIPLNDYIELDEIDLTDSEADPQLILDMQDKIELLNDKFEKRLSSLEKDVLRLHIEGYSYGFIAEKLLINEKSVDNALHRARRKLRENDTHTG